MFSRQGIVTIDIYGITPKRIVNLRFKRHTARTGEVSSVSANVQVLMYRAQHKWTGP